MSDLPVLELSDVSFAHPGGFTLEGTSFIIRRGQFVALLGPNGAGKTTLLSLITRLFDPRRGAIRIEGHPLAGRGARAMARIGVVFQQPTLDLDLSVRQNLVYAGRLWGLPRGVLAARIDEALRRFELSGRKDDKVRALNGGHRRRVELARALLHEPALLVMDEPTVGLDIPSRHSLVEHVHGLCREKGIAVLWATHLIDEVHAGDRVILIGGGRIRADGTVEEVVAAAGAKSLSTAFNLLTANAA
jgi:ABC-2 type transport system ATP-binding protein